MRKFAVLLIAVLVAACSQDLTEPADTLDSLDTGAILAYDAAGLSGPGHYLAGLHRPDGVPE